MIYKQSEFIQDGFVVEIPKYQEIGDVMIIKEKEK